tara:strand:- start:3101 stop:3388 length:288 start_codon:yes stop_codon:yes gene_type:complete
MYLRPKNRHILVKTRKVEEQEESTNSSFVLPEGYSKSTEQYAMAEVMEASEDCSVSVSRGDTVLVPTNMLLDIKIEDDEFQMILENYILGVLYGD